MVKVIAHCHWMGGERRKRKRPQTGEKREKVQTRRGRRRRRRRRRKRRRRRSRDQWPHALRSKGGRRKTSYIDAHRSKTTL